MTALFFAYFLKFSAFCAVITSRYSMLYMHLQLDILYGGGLVKLYVSSVIFVFNCFCILNEFKTIIHEKCCEIPKSSKNDR